MSDTTIRSDRAPEPVGPYPHARRVGNLVFLSGMGPRQRGTNVVPGVTRDADGNMIDYDIAIQTRSVLENIRVVLEDAGLGLDGIVDVLVFLTNIERDFAGFNRVYGEYFGGQGRPNPTRTTVQVGALPQGGDAPIAVELKVIAVAD